MEPITIGDIIQKRNHYADIQRIANMPYKMDIAMQVFTALGSREINADFKISHQNEWVIQNIIKWAHSDPTIEALNPTTRIKEPGDITKGLYIAGPCGTGKTILMRTLAQYLTIDNVIYLRYEPRMSEPSRQLMTFYSANTNRVAMFYAENGDLYQYLQQPAICFNDLGVEPQETLFMGTRLKTMQTIIQERGDARGLITHFTSNNGIIDPETKTLYGERAQSRLVKMCNYYELTGDDLRK